MEAPVFKELVIALPDWSARLKELSSRYPETTTPSRKRAPSLSICEDEPGPVVAVKTVVGPHPLKPAQPLTQPPTDQKEKEPVQECPPPPKQMSKMNAKPTAPKVKFSAINGPQIYYDGEAQAALFECWTTLNAKRGLLRKEMMGIRRKKIMTLPHADYGYSDDSEDEEDGEKKPKESAEEKKARLEEERRKAEEERIKAEREKKAAEILEFIDSCLDKAAKGCENTAFLWLKGDACPGHVNFIAGRMQDAVDRINSEIAKASGAESDVEGSEDDDEGLGADVDMEDVEQSLPNKRVEKQRLPHPPIRRAGGFAP